MASIEKRREGYRVRWRDPDGTHHSRQCPSLTVARELLREVEAAASLGRKWAPTATQRVDPIDKAMAIYIGRIGRVKARQTCATRRSALERLRAFLQAREGKGKRLHWDLLSRRLLEEWDLSMADEGLQASTRAQHLRNAMLFWEWAYDDEEFGPHVPRPRKVESPQRVPKTVRAPTWAEMDLAISKAENREARVVMTLMRCLGWRIGQVIGLRWDDIDLEAGLIRMRGELGKSRAEKAGRTTAIAKVLIDYLAGLGRREGRLVSFSRVWIHLNILKAWKASGVSPEIWDGRSAHCFRKGFRTELKAAGVDSEAIEFYCGRTTGVRDAYTDPRCLPIRDLVSKIPPIGGPYTVLDVHGVSRLDDKRAKGV
jgi:integrase